MKRSDYKPLGDYIALVNERNRDLAITHLVGVSIEKKFIPSIANIIGTDLSPYKIIRHNQFAYGPVTSRNGEKITIALYKDTEDGTLSQAYEVFRIKDEEVLMPEYLMLWVQRPEFDRYARFKSHGSVRELFSWEEMCNVMLPVPPIAEQRKIVEQYQTIERRIKNNEALIQKLEATAQALYHHTFVEGIDKENLPEGWRMGKLGDVIECFDYMRRPLSSQEREGKESKYPYYGATSIMDYIDDYIFDGDYILMGEDGSVIGVDGKPYLQHVHGKCWINNHAHVLHGKNYFDNNILYLTLKNTVISNYVTGAVQLKLNQRNMNSIPILIPCESVLKDLSSALKPIMNYVFTIEKESTKLIHIQDLITSNL